MSQVECNLCNYTPDETETFRSCSLCNSHMCKGVPDYRTLCSVCILHSKDKLNRNLKGEYQDPVSNIYYKLCTCGEIMHNTSNCFLRYITGDHSHNLVQ